MSSLSGKELAKVLERNGWILLRVRGSHHIYCKAGSTVRLSVPIHGNRSLRIGLLKHLLKTAGLSEDASHESSTIEESTKSDIADETE